MGNIGYQFCFCALILNRFDNRLLQLCICFFKAVRKNFKTLRKLSSIIRQRFAFFACDNNIIQQFHIFHCPVNQKRIQTENNRNSKKTAENGKTVSIYKTSHNNQNGNDIKQRIKHNCRRRAFMQQLRLESKACYHSAESSEAFSYAFEYPYKRLINQLQNSYDEHSAEYRIIHLNCSGNRNGKTQKDKTYQNSTQAENQMQPARMIKGNIASAEIGFRVPENISVFKH